MAQYGSIDGQGFDSESGQGENDLRSPRRKTWYRVAGCAILAVAALAVTLLRTRLMTQPRGHRLKIQTSLMSSMEQRPRHGFWQPQRLKATNARLEVDLEVVVGRLEFESGLAFNARTFNGTRMAPTLVARPGETVRITVQNKLGPEPGAPSLLNSLRNPNTTVLHAHGLHISPAGIADNVYRSAGPGESLEYVYEIPKNHPCGTFYIHPHFHGSSSLQAAYSMVSVLIIESEEEKDLFDDDFVMLVGKIDIGSGKRTDLLVDSNVSGSTLDLDIENETSGEAINFLTVNGRQSQKLELARDQVVRWRLVNGAIDGVVHLAWDQEACQVSEIAADGVSFSEPRRRSKGSGVFIPPGSRRDLAVACSTNATFISSALDSKEQKNYLGKSTKVLEGRLIFVRVQEDKSAKSSSNGTTSDKKSQNESKVQDSQLVGFKSGYLPEHISDLRTVNVDVQQVIQWTQGGPNTPKVIRGGNQYQVLGVNGHAYANESQFSVPSNHVVEWVIQNEFALDGTTVYESHPFHMHTNHFQVVDVTSETYPDFQVGDFRDTITVPAPGNVTIRWVPRDFIGKTLLHCHTLAHIDTGMALSFDITP
eukprot:CAMPEP_0184554334 /NCGR_PEP_ID=MMETSP0199_2-20130426/34700_1 /TAXON_ID=1112570 /ORGANISM="Thraustochytrium sp., Strain LLF1b" /LENGTH=592 /DNA_ID=CAMNT_0026950343 /DNA_START=8 /DNA_END=1786 /DNA_ORIENTATION=+